MAAHAALVAGHPPGLPPGYNAAVVAPIAPPVAEAEVFTVLTTGTAAGTPGNAWTFQNLDLAALPPVVSFYREDEVLLSLPVGSKLASMLGPPLLTDAWCSQRQSFWINPSLRITTFRRVVALVLHFCRPTPEVFQSLAFQSILSIAKVRLLLSEIQTKVPDGSCCSLAECCRRISRVAADNSTFEIRTDDVLSFPQPALVGGRERVLYEETTIYFTLAGSGDATLKGWALCVAATMLYSPNGRAASGSFADQLENLITGEIVLSASGRDLTAMAWEKLTTWFLPEGVKAPLVFTKFDVLREVEVMSRYATGDENVRSGVVRDRIRSVFSHFPSLVVALVDGTAVSLHGTLLLLVSSFTSVSMVTLESLAVTDAEIAPLLGVLQNLESPSMTHTDRQNACRAALLIEESNLRKSLSGISQSSSGVDDDSFGSSNLAPALFTSGGGSAAALRRFEMTPTFQEVELDIASGMEDLELLEATLFRESVPLTAYLLCGARSRGSRTWTTLRAASLALPRLAVRAPIRNVDRSMIPNASGYDWSGTGIDKIFSLKNTEEIQWARLQSVIETRSSRSNSLVPELLTFEILEDFVSRHLLVFRTLVNLGLAVKPSATPSFGSMQSLHNEVFDLLTSHTPRHMISQVVGKLYVVYHKQIADYLDRLRVVLHDLSDDDSGFPQFNPAGSLLRTEMEEILDSLQTREASMALQTFESKSVSQEQYDSLKAELAAVKRLATGQQQAARHLKRKGGEGGGDEGGNSKNQKITGLPYAQGFLASGVTTTSSHVCVKTSRSASYFNKAEVAAKVRSMDPAFDMSKTDWGYLCSFSNNPATRKAWASFDTPEAELKLPSGWTGKIAYDLRLKQTPVDFC